MLIVPLVQEGSLNNAICTSHLEGEDAVGALELDDADLPEGAAPDHLQDLEVVLAQPQRLDPVRHAFHCKMKRKRISIVHHLLNATIHHIYQLRCTTLC